MQLEFLHVEIVQKAKIIFLNAINSMAVRGCVRVLLKDTPVISRDAI